MSRQPAILLLGPTGSGKSPLGKALEAAGWDGKRCAHFDFGAWLRRCGSYTPEAASFLNDDELGVVRSALAGGALLEDEQFPIATKILEAFRSEQTLPPGDFIVLNGLPRHLGQAADLDALIDLRFMVELACDAETIRARIRLNSGGDRDGRVDDSLPEIERKLAIYHERTLPLSEHYRALGVPLRQFQVGVATSAEAILNRLNATVR